MSAAPVLNAGRYVLRPWLLSDVDFVMHAARDPDIATYSSVAAAATAPQARAWIESRTAGDRFDWVIDTTSHPVGRASLAHIDQEDRVAEVGYWVLSRHRRRGVASTALEALEGFAFGMLGIHRLYIRHEPENLPSCALAASRGYLPEGTQRGAFERDGRRRDLHVHALLVSDER